MVLEEEFTVGELTAFIAYTALLTLPLMGLGWVTTMFQQGMVGLASVSLYFNNQSLCRSPVSTGSTAKETIPRWARTQSPFRYAEDRPGFYRTSTST